MNTASYPFHDHVDRDRQRIVHDLEATRAHETGAGTRSVRHTWRWLTRHH